MYIFREQYGFLQISPAQSVRQNRGSHCVWLCEQLGAASWCPPGFPKAWVSQCEEGGLCFQTSGSRCCGRTLRTRWNFSRRAACGAPTPRLPQRSLCTKPVVRASLSCGLGAGPRLLPRPTLHLPSPRRTLSQQGLWRDSAQKLCIPERPGGGSLGLRRTGGGVAKELGGSMLCQGAWGQFVPVRDAGGTP